MEGDPIDFNLQSEKVESKPRKLRAKWSIVASMDLMREFIHPGQNFPEFKYVPVVRWYQFWRKPCTRNGKCIIARDDRTWKPVSRKSWPEEAQKKGT